jgi:DNA polymerase I
LKEKLCLIDGNAYIHRAYHALPALTNSRGEPVGALFGFARMLLKILRQEKPARSAVCFDTAAPTFRHKAFAGYKATRKELDEALIFQLPLARKMVEAWGFPVAVLEGYEADDLIGTLARRGAREGLEVLIVTGDKDALQMVDADISVLSEPSGVRYTEEEVRKKYGLPPDRLTDFFALTGDSSDNVPGVPGVGPVTAARLLQKYGTLDKVLSGPPDMKESLRKKLETHREQALKSRELVVLDCASPLSLTPADCALRPPDAAGLTELFARLEFHKLLAEILPPAAKTSERRVRLAVSAEDFHALGRELAAARELALDAETTGTDCLQCGLVGISLAVKPGEAWYIPVGHEETRDRNAAALRLARETLAPFLADAKLPKVGQNLKFDLMVLRRHGFPMENPAFDTLLASYCLNPSRLTHNLKDLALDLLGETMTRIEELIGKGAKRITMDKVPVAAAADYAAADAEVALRLKEKMAAQLKEKGLEKLFHEVEMPLLRILADMEEAGIGVDAPYLKELGESLAGEIAALEGDVQRLAGQAFNPASSKQLAVLLFDKLGLPVVRRNKTGPSTDEEVLKKLSALHPLPAKVLEYRELSKLKSTYVDALLSLVNPSTGRIHTSFNQAVAATGRLSSSDPNLQNIPIRTPHGRRIRRAFVAGPVNVFLSADYSQIDLRVLAHMSGAAALREAFRRGGDVHASTARDIFGLGEKDEPSADQRRAAKTVNFGIVYGQTAFGLAQQLGIDVAQAKDYIEKYFRRYAGVKAWTESMIETARKEGRVSTLLGRVRYLPEINASNGAVRAFAERTAVNTPIQGTSADIIKAAMAKVDALLRGRAGTRMLLQVHDELLFEAPRAEAETLAPVIRRAMEEAVPLEVPVVVDVKIGVNWLDMEKVGA